MQATEPHGQSVLRDHQVLRVRPVVRLGEIQDERWLVAIGEKRSELQGGSIASLLPKVLEAVDGRRDVDEIVSILDRDHGTRPSATRGCLQRLYDWQILDDVSGYQMNPDARRTPSRLDHESQRRYFGLFSSRPLFNQTALCETRVAVVGDGDGPAAIRGALCKAGLEVVTAGGGSLEEVDCAVAWGSGLGDGVLAEHNRECVERRIPWLAVTQHNERGDLGPMVVPGRSACWECVIDHFEGGCAPEAALSPCIKTALTKSVGSVLAQLAALEVLRFAAPCLRPSLIGRRQRYDPGACRLTETGILRRLRCRCCGALAGHSPVAPFQERGDKAHVA